jgi:hypothetical protein
MRCPPPIYLERVSGSQILLQYVPWDCDTLPVSRVPASPSSVANLTHVTNGKHKKDNKKEKNTTKERGDKHATKWQ